MSPQALIKNIRKNQGPLVSFLVFLGFQLSSPPGTLAQHIDNSPVASKVRIISQIDSVSVFTNSVFQGFTPCQAATSNSGQLVLELGKEDYSPAYDTLALNPGNDTTIAVRLKKLGVLRLGSEPESARVSIGMKPVGMTPLVLSTIPGDTLDLALTLPGYQQWATTAVPAEGSSIDIVASLVREEPSISVMVDPPNASVALDGIPVSKGPVRDYLTTVGAHQLVVRDDSSGRVTELTTSFSETKRYFFKAKFGTVLGDRLFGAFVVPGYAQIADGQFIKGSVILIGTLSLGYLAVLAQNEYSDRLRAYDLATELYVGAATDVEATRRHEDLLLRKSDLDKYYARRTVAFSLVVGAYVYGLIDALLNHIVGDTLEIVPVRDIPGLSFPPDTQGAQVRIKL